MKKIYLIKLALGFLFLSIVGCEKEENFTKIPDCINDKINVILNGNVWNPPTKIYSFQYNGQTVYYFPSQCCDVPSSLYDENCNFICSPDGGITGNGDGNCTDFFDSRTNEKLIWEDIRE